MKAAFEHRDFHFVDYDHARVPQGAETRRLIRQHAMRDVAATRRQKGSYGRKRKPGSTTSRSNWHPALRPPPANENDLSMRQHFPILEFIAPLTSLHLGIATISCCFPQPALHTSPPTLTLQSRRILSYIPSRYGQALCLTYTVDCVVAKMGEVMRLDGYTGSGALYVKALRAVQTAIDDPDTCVTAETLCALKLLEVFELLDETSGTSSWAYHAGGAARLMQLRGPGQFQTGFDLALFMSLCGSVVTEAFLNNKTCFLTDETWQKVIYSAIREDSSIPPTQARLMHEIWSHLVFGPTIFRMITDLILGPISPSSDTVERAIERVQMDLDHLQMWAEMFQSHQVINEDELATSRTVPIPWRVLEGTYTLCTMVKSRLLTCLAPSRFRHIEIQCQALADTVVGASAKPAFNEPERLSSGLYAAQTVWIAQSIVQTKDVWLDGTGEKSEGMIERWKFEAWCNAFGRKVT